MLSLTLGGHQCPQDSSLLLCTLLDGWRPRKNQLSLGVYMKGCVGGSPIPRPQHNANRRAIHLSDSGMELTKKVIKKWNYSKGSHLTYPILFVCMFRISLVTQAQLFTPRCSFADFTLTTVPPAGEVMKCFQSAQLYGKKLRCMTNGLYSGLAHACVLFALTLVNVCALIGGLNSLFGPSKLVFRFLPKQ